MKVLRDLKRLRPFATGTVVAIGNFDGLHLGHRRILSRVSSLARRKGLTSVVLTFDPHPVRSLKDRSIPLIQTLDQRLEGLEAAGIDVVLVLPFGKSFSRLSGGDFAEGILAGALRAREIVVGEDFRFGSGRSSDVAHLARLGRDLGFRVHSIPHVLVDGRAVSSSRIRELLGRGEVEAARRFLGRPYGILGRVVRGASRGTRLGAPTANLRTRNEILPRGVFVSLASAGGRLRPAATNIGTAPTFGGRKLVVETHIPGARESLYGRDLRLFFLKKIRNERTFRSPEALARRIRLDIEAVRGHFKTARARKPS